MLAGDCGHLVIFSSNQGWIGEEPARQGPGSDIGIVPGAGARAAEIVSGPPHAAPIDDTMPTTPA